MQVQTEYNKKLIDNRWMCLSYNTIEREEGIRERLMLSLGPRRMKAVAFLVAASGEWEFDGVVRNGRVERGYFSHFVLGKYMFTWCNLDRDLDEGIVI